MFDSAVAPTVGHDDISSLGKELMEAYHNLVAVDPDPPTCVEAYLSDPDEQLVARLVGTDVYLPATREVAEALAAATLCLKYLHQEELKRNDGHQVDPSSMTTHS